jgi:kynurenine 3-monooxygenase
MSPIKTDYTIVGAGLVGSLLSIGLSKLGYKVDVLEKRSDPTLFLQQGNRSINLALSHRGIEAIQSIDSQLSNNILNASVPMFGRTIHDELGDVFFQPYGLEKECIYSVHRQDLNAALIQKAKAIGVDFSFDTNYIHKETNQKFVIAADGVHSNVRKHYEVLKEVESVSHTLDYGYIEIEIPKELGHLINGKKESLHIWPRKNFMLIALPNNDGSYTSTLFLPFKGEVSFESLNTEETITTFYTKYFPDFTQLFSSITSVHKAAPISQLTYIKTNNWFGKQFMLIGDAAHGIVPFYGQGMNAGFEDVRVFLELLQYKHSFEEILSTYYKSRKDNTDAILQLALDNFVEMRDSVSQPSFKLKKLIEGFLQKTFPLQFVSAYRMVSFTSIPYSQALHFANEFEIWFQQEIRPIPSIERIEEDIVIQQKVKEKYLYWYGRLLS